MTKIKDSSFSHYLYFPNLIFHYFCRQMIRVKINNYDI